MLPSVRGRRQSTTYGSRVRSTFASSPRNRCDPTRAPVAHSVSHGAGWYSTVALSRCRGLSGSVLPARTRWVHGVAVQPGIIRGVASSISSRKVDSVEVGGRQIHGDA
jgi:hypothetical protein